MSRRKRSSENLPAPFLKWAGGKGQLLCELLSHLPQRFNNYHEPFLGGGALFFGLARSGLLDGRTAYLSDTNPELIATYRAIQSDVTAVISALRSHRHDRDEYYRVRAQDWRALPASEAAARMIFLNRTGFNGLYRVNNKGRFNVPFGRYKNPTVCDEENLLAASRALRGVKLALESFEHVVSRARRGDLVYFDPPYVPISRTASFVSYAPGGFSVEDQERLARTFEELKRRGVNVMLSNSSAPWVRERYRNHYLTEVMARRNVNSKGDRRGPVKELLVTSYRVQEE
jgi:DNA adenine methylase